jgi:YHS domain-containing protein
MFRFLFVLLASVLMITVIRSVVGLIVRAFSDLTKGPSQAATRPGTSVPVAGELKKDPVCGTYVSTATQFSRNSPNGTVYFCSAECRDRYKT